MMAEVYPVFSKRPKGIAKMGTKIGFKITALLFAIMGIVLLVDTSFHYRTSAELIKHNTEKQLVALAVNFAAALNPQEVELLKSEADENSPVYRKLQLKLQKFQKRNTGVIKYIYVIGRTGSSYYFLLDAVPIGQRDHSALGHKFDIARFPEAVKGFVKPTAETEPVWDQEFGLYSQSGYAPIVDAKGKTVGLLGIDMDLPVIQIEHQTLVQALVTEIGLALILALVFGAAFSFYVTKPVCSLAEGFEKVAAGDFDWQVNIRRRDEFGMLAGSFNRMAGDLKTLHFQLHNYNQQLEAEVQHQTAQLTRVNRDMQDIMDNISLGIFTIDREFRLQPQYSKFLELIFDKGLNDSLANCVLGGLLFPDPRQRDERQSLDMWLELLFEPGQLKWPELLQIQPVEEVWLEEGERRCLRLEFLPVNPSFAVMESKQVEKVMVLIEDITKTRCLEKELEERDQAFKENVEQMVSLVRTDPEMIRQFLIESNDELADLEIDMMRLIDKGKIDVMPGLLRIAHTIKGNAGNCGLWNISNTTHALEELLQRLRQEPVGSPEWAGQVYKRIDKLKDQLAQVETVFWQIVDQRVKDTGQTRTANRVKESSGMLKVNTADFKNLEEMVLRIRDKVGPGPVDTELGTLFELVEEQLLKLQMVKVGRIFSRFRRMVHDISEELGKKVALKMSGEEISVEKYIFDWVADPMIHLLRNALDHGIESPRERISLGKNEEGTIRIEVFLKENFLVVEVADDGRGLDLALIREQVLQKQLRTPEELYEMTEEEQLQLIFLPGFSTNETVTQISGRGIGMDIVKSVVEGQLYGKVILENRDGFGLNVRMEIPLRLARRHPGKKEETQ